jgi:hypothetical protein
MTGNNSFSSPNPSLEEITAAAVGLENAYEEAQDGAKTKKILLRQCDSKLKGLIRILAAYVQNVSAGEVHIILSSGFDVKRRKTTPIPATNPTRLRGEATNHEGEVIIRWDRADGARSYIAEMSTDGVIWKLCGVATRAKMIISGLLEGSKVFFRVASIGSLGQSGWSDASAVRVL